MWRMPILAQKVFTGLHMQFGQPGLCTATCKLCVWNRGAAHDNPLSCRAAAGCQLSVFSIYMFMVVYRSPEVAPLTCKATFWIYNIFLKKSIQHKSYVSYCNNAPLAYPDEGPAPAKALLCPHASELRALFSFLSQFNSSFSFFPTYWSARAAGAYAASSVYWKLTTSEFQ